jgi:manganese efflux pump family protein
MILAMARSAKPSGRKRPEMPDRPKASARSPLCCLLVLCANARGYRPASAQNSLAALDGQPWVVKTYLEAPLQIHDDLTVLAKTFAVALAVGLDVLAVSIGVGVARLARDASLKLGLAFAGSEISMQVLGYELGAKAGKMLGEIGAYAGFALLALVGVFMIRSSLRSTHEAEFEATRGVGLFMTSLSISLDSLGVGVALPAVAIPLLPLLIIVSITTTFFTLLGLEFGARLGERYEHGAELLAGIILIVLAALFTAERLI